MYGVIIEVEVDASREQEARRMLREVIVPRARTHRGFSDGYWLRALQGDVLRAVQIFDTEANAVATAERIRSEGAPPGAPVTLRSVETYEVVAEA
jgi:hypothetical protein